MLTESPKILEYLRLIKAGYSGIFEDIIEGCKIVFLSKMKKFSSEKKFFEVDKEKVQCKIILKKILKGGVFIGGKLKEFKILYRNLKENVVLFFVRRGNYD